jgi:hypothetical protein
LLGLKVLFISPLCAVGIWLCYWGLCYAVANDGRRLLWGLVVNLSGAAIAGVGLLPVSWTSS